MSASSCTTSSPERGFVSESYGEGADRHTVISRG